MTGSIQPVLVGAGQLVDRASDSADALDPLAMMTITARACAIDADLHPRYLKELDTLVVVDTVGPKLMNNPPMQLAQRLGASPPRQFVTVTGGNTPQMLVNHFAKEIAAERASMVLLSGAEALHTLARSAKTGQPLNWEKALSADLGAPAAFSEDRPGSNATERAHGMVAPIVTYPLFENALRHHAGRSLSDHQMHVGRLFAPFTELAADNPYAWFPRARSAAEIATPTRDNRYVGFPYTKYMNAVMQVNQSASVLLMSDAKARAMGIDESRWIYLHGHCDINDVWHVSERIDFHSSPALRSGLTSTFHMAGISADDIAHFDVYSCFPAVVEMTRDLLEMRANDPRLLTVTGGLPYFGGAGNNYSMHAIASMMQRLRAAPGDYGLVTANGWYLTKHALGVYSTTRPNQAFAPQDRKMPNRFASSVEHPQMDPRPSGPGTVDTFTVMFDRHSVPTSGLVIGTLESGARFVAHTRSDESTLTDMTQVSPIGRRGRVVCGHPTHLFEFDE